jgi:HD-GYP domain-containing protein (c-di-GMP phosphodiesterase class II)
MTTKPTQSRLLLLTYRCLAELGPMLAGERDFNETAHSMLRAMMEAVEAREGALFTFCEKPAQLKVAAWRGYALFPEAGFVSLNSRQVHALETTSGAVALSAHEHGKFLSSNGNVAPEMFKCILPLRVGAKLAGIVGLGSRIEAAHTKDAVCYGAEELEALTAFSHYVALAVHNHNLTESLQRGVVEHLHLLDSVHKFCDQAMEVFASAIDAKEYRSSPHSLRVGRYAAALGSAHGLNSNEVAELRAAGYLHDIGKVAVDKHLFMKAAPLDPREFREVADHTVVGHRIVSGIRFPWPGIADVVRWHHERSDGSGYPDNLHDGEISQTVRIIAVADTFDAMTSARPYRKTMSLEKALSEIVRSSPAQLDADAVQSLLKLVRGEAVGYGPRFLDSQVTCKISPAAVDRLAADLQIKASHGRSYSAHGGMN